MTDIQANAFTYICSLIEYTARQTSNRRSIIVDALGKAGVQKLLDTVPAHYSYIDALLTDGVQFLEPFFDQAASEIIRTYGICDGDFDTISNCQYPVPDFQHIGRLYYHMIEDCAMPSEETDELLRIFRSFISEEISNFKTGIYMENPDYLEWSYREGHLLD